MSGRGAKKRLSLAAPIATAMAAVAALAGCGGGSVIDDRAAEIDVREGLKQLGVKVQKVDCPDDVDVEKGAAYACRAETPGGDFRIVYRQLDEEGSVGTPKLERLPREP